MAAHREQTDTPAAETASHNDDRPPAAEARAKYAQTGAGRYADLAEALEAMLAETDIDPTTATAATLASAVVAWLTAAQADADLRPSSVAKIGSWVDDAVDAAYEDGIADAREMLRDAGVALDRSTVAARLNQPAHQQALSALRATQRQQWRSLAADLEDDIRETVRAAVRDDVSRGELADRLQARIDAVGEHRAELIGETEPARAYHRAQLAEYRLVGVQEVRVEWATMGDHRVCARCRTGSAASPYSLEQAEGLLPHHPRCRCWFEPIASSLSGPRR